jgi:hypothetical protein
MDLSDNEESMYSFYKEYLDFCIANPHCDLDQWADCYVDSLDLQPRRPRSHRTNYSEDSTSKELITGMIDNNQEEVQKHGETVVSPTLNLTSRDDEDKDENAICENVFATSSDNDHEHFLKDGKY